MKPIQEFIDKYPGDPEALVDALAKEIRRLENLLDAARICLKNRDQSPIEAKVYAAICAAMAGDEVTQHETTDRVSKLQDKINGCAPN